MTVLVLITKQQTNTSNTINNNNNNNNNNKYEYLPASYLFEPIAFETLGPMNLSALNLLNDLGRKISSVSGDDREGHFLFQRLSVILQRYNAVLLHEVSFLSLIHI